MSQQHAAARLPVSRRGSSHGEGDDLIPDAGLDDSTKATGTLRIVILLWSVVSIGLILIAIAHAFERGR
jgi:hypothetical protein